MSARYSYTIPQLSALWGVDPTIVRGLIDQGHLVTTTRTRPAKPHEHIGRVRETRITHASAVRALDALAAWASTRHPQD